MELIIIQKKIHTIRGQQVMLDYDLAEMFEVETRTLKQATRRNLERFPEDFMFELTLAEWKTLRSQSVILENGGNYKPFVFTEHGVIMLASILRSERATQMSIAVVRAFVTMRSLSMHYKDLAQKIIEMEGRYDTQFSDIYAALKFLMDKKAEEISWEDRNLIGFNREKE